MQGYCKCALVSIAPVGGLLLHKTYICPLAVPHVRVPLGPAGIMSRRLREWRWAGRRHVAEQRTVKTRMRVGTRGGSTERTEEERSCAALWPRRAQRDSGTLLVQCVEEVLRLYARIVATGAICLSISKLCCRDAAWRPACLERGVLDEGGQLRLQAATCSTAQARTLQGLGAGAPFLKGGVRRTVRGCWSRNTLRCQWTHVGTTLLKPCPRLRGVAGDVGGERLVFVTDQHWQYPIAG